MRLRSTKIASDLNASLPKPVTTRTVRTYLKELVFEYVIKVKKQWLSVQHRQQRVAWCTRHMNWSSDDWKNVIFSDESTFYVLKRKNQCKIWRLEKEKLHCRSVCNKPILVVVVEKLEFGEVYRALERPMQRFTQKI